MFEIKNLTIKIEDRYLVKDLSIVLNKGDKLAIIGEEGNGKSTLLKALVRICDYVKVEGVVNTHEKRVGYLPQVMDGESLKSKVSSYLFQEKQDYYDKIGDFYSFLDVLELKDAVLEQEISTLSGGEKVKVGILKLLLDECDILLLDEPSNDLDIDTLEWLENFIKNTEKIVIYISHDETLLANTANMILHLEQIRRKTMCSHTLLKADYDTYVNLRIRKIDKDTQVAKSEMRKKKKQQEQLNQIMQKVEYQQNTISRKDPHGAKMLKKKMHSLKLQEKRLSSVELTEIPDVEESIQFFFDDVEVPKMKKILDFHLTKLKIKEKTLARNIELEVVGGSHICIIGKNGVGKSTLIKEIEKNLKDRVDIKLGYMPQNYEEMMDFNQLVLDFLISSKEKLELTKARTYLGNMKFTNQEMLGKIKDLSNGSKAKLFLVKLVLEKCNVLLLDEPTRNLSPLSNPVIRKALREYKGAIISVSHDRRYILEVIDFVYELTSDGLMLQ